MHGQNPYTVRCVVALGQRCHQRPAFLIRQPDAHYILGGHHRDRHIRRRNGILIAGYGKGQGPDRFRRLLPDKGQYAGQLLPNRIVLRQNEGRCSQSPGNHGNHNQQNQQELAGIPFFLFPFFQIGLGSRRLFKPVFRVLPHPGAVLGRGTP